LPASFGSPSPLYGINYGMVIRVSSVFGTFFLTFFVVSVTFTQAFCPTFEPKAQA
jgi:hypothetical protein